ncbi:hypothetical protein AB6B38_07425 [Glycocaulis abyssi]
MTLKRMVNRVGPHPGFRIASRRPFNSKPIIYIEPQRDYAPIFDRILNKPRFKDAPIYVPSPHHMEQVIKCGEERGLAMRERMLPYSTISMDFDDFIFSLGFSLAQDFYDIVVSSSGLLFNDRHRFLHPETRWATIITCLDRFVGQMRPSMEFERLLKLYDVDHVYLVPSPAGRTPILEAVVTDVIGDRRVSVLTGHIVNLAERKHGQSAANPFVLNPKPRRFPAYQFTSKDVKRNNIAFIANFQDKQYDYSLLPILPKILEKYNVVLMNYMIHNRPRWIDQEQFKAALEERRIEYFEKVAKTSLIKFGALEKKFMTSVLRRFNSKVRAYGDEAARYADLLTLYLAKSAFPLLTNIAETRTKAHDILRHSHALVLLPGRTLEANIFTGCARAKGIPTIEIQSGTISPLRRFIRPQADEVLAIDPFSRSVYTRFLGKEPDKVIVTGGPKLEYDLSQVRGMSKQEARASIPQLAPLQDARILVLASQPIGVDHATTIARLAIEACSGTPDLWLAIKPHPSEKEKYLKAYRELAEEVGLERFVILEGVPVLHAVVAADIVATYFSTVGLEAFALTRDVICINPFDSRPPFDLVEIGVASEVKTASQMHSRIEVMLANPGEGTQSDALLDRIRDGRAIERVYEHILERAAGHQTATSLLRPHIYRRKMRSLLRLSRITVGRLLSRS